MKLSGYPIAANKLRISRIVESKIESPSVKTVIFKDRQCSKAKPGQFLLLWIPKVDEIPLSISDVKGGEQVSVAVKKVGEATAALHELDVGEHIGVRGPFGNSFSIRRGKILLVGGGTGIAPLLFLAKKLVGKSARLSFIMGAKTKEELLFRDEIRSFSQIQNVITTTEDGSYGLKCMVTGPLEEKLLKDQFDYIYTCGPEQMMQKVFNLAEKYAIPLEGSLERLMRCAIGLCGSCVVGKYRVCRDGPVFSGERLKDIRSEFGISKRDFYGRNVML